MFTYVLDAQKDQLIETVLLSTICEMKKNGLKSIKYQFWRDQSWAELLSTHRIGVCKPNIYVSWSTSELRVRLAPLNRFKPSSKIFYWPFQGGTSFVDLLCFCSVLCLLCFVRVCLYVLRGHLLGKGWPLGSCLWCLLWVCHFPIGILGQVWYLIVSIPDLCNLTYFVTRSRSNQPYQLRGLAKYCKFSYGNLVIDK